MPRLGAGALREVLVILQSSVTTDDHGARTATAWSTLTTLPAELIPLRAGETLQAQQVQSLVDYRFRVRARTDVTPGMRAQWRPAWAALSTPKALEIHGVLPIGDGRQWMALECGEVASA